LYITNQFENRAHTYFPETYTSYKDNLNTIPQNQQDLDALRVTLVANVNQQWTNANCPSINTSLCTHINDIVMQNAQRFIKFHLNKPFFLALAPTYPHIGKFNTQEPDSSRYQPVKIFSPWRIKQTAVLRGHASSIEQHLDRDVGMLLDLLESYPTLNNNTLFIFTSDNGPDHQKPLDKTIYTPAGGLRGWKRSMLEGGLREPTILRWPGVIQTGITSKAPHALYDLGPTIRDLVKLPTLDAYTQDGKPLLSQSMWPVWESGNDTKLVRDFLHFELCGKPGKDNNCDTATLDLRDWENGIIWKYIRIQNNSKSSYLYKIKTDITERKSILDPVRNSNMRQIRNSLRTPFTTC
jgi:arylsulfatase A-like enzyme